MFKVVCPKQIKSVETGLVKTHRNLLPKSYNCTVLNLLLLYPYAHDFIFLIPFVNIAKFTAKYLCMATINWSSMFAYFGGVGLEGHPAMPRDYSLALCSGVTPSGA